MNRIIIIFLLSIFLSIPVAFASEQMFPEAEKAGQLYNLCKALDGTEPEFNKLDKVEDKQKALKSVLCLAYIKGFYYGVVAQEIFIEDDIKKTCVSDHVVNNILEIKDFFIRFVEENPERKNELSMIVLHKVLTKSYACKK